MSAADDMLARIKGNKAKYSQRGDTYKIKEGKTTVRIIDPDNTMTFMRDFGVHWIKPEKNAKPLAVVGSRMVTYNQPCEIQTMIDRAAKAAPDDATLEVIKDWGAKKSALMPAIIRSGSDASEDAAVILELTPTTWGQISNMIEEYYADSGYILDVKKGFDFVIERTGKGLDTKYTIMPKPGAKPVSQKALENLPNIDDFIAKKFLADEVTRACNAITAITGVARPNGNAGNLMLTGGGTAAIGGATQAARLTQAKPVEEADVIEEVVAEAEAAAAVVETKEPDAPAKAEAAPAKAAVATPSAADVDDILAELENL